MKREKRYMVWIMMALMTATMAVLLGGCQQVDKTPSITLEGPDTVEITLGEAYPEHGYSAQDYQGNDITTKVKLDVPDLSVVGDQFVKYTVTDQGETVTETRILKNRHKQPPVLAAYEDYDSYEDYAADYETYTEYLYKGIPILMYHNVYDPVNPPENLHNNYISTTDLESHLQYLVDENYYFPTWQEVRDFVDCKIDLPEKSIVLTFDDGSRDFITYGIPILEKYDIKATSFVIVSWKGEELAAMDLHNVQLQSHSYDMHRGGGNIGHGGVFTALSYEDAMEDLRKSKEIIGNSDAFAYPFGDYTDYCMQIIEDAGYLCAVTTVGDKVYPGDNPYALSRLRVSLGDDLEAFKDMIE